MYVKYIHNVLLDSARVTVTRVEENILWNSNIDSGGPAAGMQNSLNIDNFNFYVSGSLNKPEKITTG